MDIESEVTESLTYQELSPKAQRTAFEEWANYGVEPYDDWYEDTFDWWEGLLAERGITDVEINFTGFSSQGDGASFTGDIDLRILMEWETGLIQSHPEVYISQLGIDPEEWANYGVRLIRNTSHYCHENSVSLDWEVECSDENLEAFFNEGLEDDILEVCRGWMKELYRDLEKSYDWNFSEECFLDYCGDYRYNAEGERNEGP